MPTKEELSEELNKVLPLSEPINFDRLNKNSLKRLLNTVLEGLELPYEIEQENIPSLEDFEEIIEKAAIVKYSVPLEEPTLIMEAVKDGIVYLYSENVRTQLERTADTYAVLEVLGENIELIVSPEEITMQEARARNKEKISEVIEEKYPTATPGKITI